MSAVPLAPASTEQEAQKFVPPVPESIEDLGISPSFLEQLILKILYFKNEITGRLLATQLGLNFSVAEPLIDQLKRQHLLVTKSSLGMGSVSSVFTLTEAGRELAREYLESNSYCGRIPVPISQYSIGVQMQSVREGWLTPEKLYAAYKYMVVSDRILNQVGPAVNAGKSFLIYGRPGNGKTYLAEGLFYLESDPVFVPHAIECQGQIIQLFDPIYHQPVESTEEEESILSISKAMEHDARWVKCRRPFIVSGGELTLEMLDLSFNPGSKVYDAPFHMKANNGIYLIDDFGRQKVTPAEVLNRWIVPMERRIDFLSFRTGGKVSVPFETFLVFSTNLKPEQLGDEAFLRRIQYKMFLRSPDETEFLEIFHRVCEKEHLPAPPAVVEEFLARYYRAAGKPMRRCHPRDIITHALDLIRFESLAYELTTDLLDRAYECAFVNEEYED